MRRAAILALALLAACAHPRAAPVAPTPAPRPTAAVVVRVACPLPAQPSAAALAANGLIGSNALLLAWAAHVAEAQRACR
jgi:hypothetical protein